MIMQETELKITDIFRVLNYHIDCKHIYYVIELKSVLSTSYEFDFHSRIPLTVIEQNGHFTSNTLQLFVTRYLTINKVID